MEMFHELKVWIQFSGEPDFNIKKTEVLLMEGSEHLEKGSRELHLGFLIDRQKEGKMDK